MDTSKLRQHPPESNYARVLEELTAIRRELAAFRGLLDTFAAAYLNAKFPFGKPTDRWRRGRG